MYIMSSEKDKGFFSNLSDKISSATRSITSSTKGAVQSIKQSTNYVIKKQCEKSWDNKANYQYKLEQLFQ